MPSYRAYLVDKDGYFHSSVALICDDDDAARAAAKNIVDGHDVELWQLDQKLGLFRHDPYGEASGEGDQRSASFPDVGPVANENE